MGGGESDLRQDPWERLPGRDRWFGFRRSGLTGSYGNRTWSPCPVPLESGQGKQLRESFRMRKLWARLEQWMILGRRRCC